MQAEPRPTLTLPRMQTVLPEPPEPLAAGDLASIFSLDRSYTFLNHGSFGAVPKEVQAVQNRWRLEIEARPIEFLGRRLDGLLADARAQVAAFVGASADRLGFVTNATEGVNAVLAAIDWREGDEIVVLDQVYNAMRQSVRRLADRWGVRLVEVGLPYPVAHPDGIVERVLGALGPRTRMLLIDHVTSPTAVVVPIERMVREARARGIVVLVDGAHAPGSIPLAIDRIGADAYVANLHKWCCAPKGAAILVVDADLAPRVHPLATSHRYGEGFAREFDWQGTRDVTPFLTSPAAIAFFDRYGWNAVRAHNHALARWAQATLAARWNTPLLTPSDGSMLASMAPVRLPASIVARYARADAFQAWLYAEERIEVPIIEWKGAWHARVSCHLHVRPEDVLRLAEAVSRIA